MTITNINDVQEQVQKWWSPKFTKELRASNIIASLLDKTYSGDLKRFGDTVYISQLEAPVGELLTVGVDADAFSTKKLVTQRVAITANKRAVAAVEIEDLVDIQSQLGQQDSEIRQSLLYAVNQQINTYLYSLMVPSAGDPDHQLVTTDFNSATVALARKTAAQALWPAGEPKYLVLDPSYYSDVLDDTTLSSSDFGATDAPIIGGQLGLKRMGFTVLEDNALTEDIGYAFYKDCVHLVMQTQPTFKLSDLHAQGKFGYVLSVDMIFGAALGIAGGSKMIKWTAA